MKFNILLTFCFLTITNIGNGQQSDTIPVYRSNYQHIVFKIDSNYLNYTDMISIFGIHNVLRKGFHNIKIDPGFSHYNIDGKPYKRQYCLVSEIDTIDNIQWQMTEKIQPICDSSCLDKKINYSFVLHKFEETKLSEDSIKKIRIVFPEDFYSAQQEWILLKLLFYQDSTILIGKITDVVDFTGRKIIFSKTIKLSPKEKKSFLPYLDDLVKQQEGLVCTTKIWPWLLEYYNGNSEFYYFYSNDCKDYKKIIRQCDKIIGKMLYKSRKYK